MKLINTFSIIVALLLLTAPIKANAQEDEGTENSSELITGKILLQASIGGPNMKKWSYDANNYNNQETRGSFHYGLSGEIRVSRTIGIGFDAIYSPFERTIQSDYYYDPETGTSVMQNSETVVTENKFRFIPKVYIHFNVNDPSWDLYISGGIGINYIDKEVRVDGEKTDDYYNDYYGDFPIMETPFPYAGRFCFGTRYYLNDIFGFSFETGIGGPALSFGINARFL
ncbi:hypothetical protein [Brumimicrobium aurantiacum]|uniref:Outer membrane protein beta-barrel domain-containing protein n=1 Tax=Brumimicrobium aurantiacum TaxID=1737063 RepID=A0A3E1EVW5_9FLAO|nr:hypothetical protein [Brumimicrobium aurantiacum]RFC53699.1 hypothetical protein DXU93_11255 [Brumimicrobium aurantiacum]